MTIFILKYCQKYRGAFRKETHAHRGLCAGSRTARISALAPFGLKLLVL